MIIIERMGGIPGRITDRQTDTVAAQTEAQSQSKAERRI